MFDFVLTQFESVPLNLSFRTIFEIMEIFRNIASIVPPYPPPSNPYTCLECASAIHLFQLTQHTTHDPLASTGGGGGLYIVGTVLVQTVVGQVHECLLHVLLSGHCVLHCAESKQTKKPLQTLIKYFYT